MHYVSKLTTVLWQPLTWVALSLFLGVLLLFARTEARRLSGRRLCATALLILVVVGWHPVPDAMLRYLEDKHAAPTGALGGYAGMVVLGGAFARDDGREHLQPALGCAGERVVVPVPLMSSYPGMKLLFTGGDASILPGGERPEADAAREYFERMGTDMSRVLTEGKSRNTYENAVFSRDVAGVDSRQPWLLVTSAAHMPRALATFRKAGWNVTPYPVDYETARDSSWFGFSFYGGLASWHTALREYLGIAAYWMTGRL